MFQQLIETGIRLTLEAEELIKNSDQKEEILAKLKGIQKPFVNKEDIEKIIEELKPQTIVIQPAGFNPIAKEYSASIDILHSRDVTGKSRTRGEVDDFISYFRSRHEKLAKLLRGPSKYPTISLREIKKYIGQTVKIIVTINAKSETKKGNLLLEIEDLEAQFKAVVSPAYGREKVFEKCKGLLNDDVVAIVGKIQEPYIIADDIEWPDLPITREKKFAENDLTVAYISDMHFGSRYFLDRYFEEFIQWVHGNGESKDLASKLKYIVVAGDIVDGIGIYPNQERELVIKDISKQYEVFNDFAERLPDHIEMIVAPGNHDAVRRGEPMPAIGKDLITSDVTLVGNPSTVIIEGLKHLIYHGTSMDSLIASLPNMSYNHPEKVMVEYLKRRHLSTIYGGNLIIPEKVDYLVIEDEPDVLHCGHVHKNGYTQYRGTLVINSGTFQDQTEYQIKQGHVPSPALVPVYEMKTGKLRTLDFKG